MNMTRAAQIRMKALSTKFISVPPKPGNAKEGPKRIGRNSLISTKEFDLSLTKVVKKQKD
jgi:hypothetical protein